MEKWRRCGVPDIGEGTSCSSEEFVLMGRLKATIACQ